MVTVYGPSVLLFVVEVLKVEPEPAVTLHRGTEDRTVLERKLKLETVICIHVEVIILYKVVYSLMQKS